ncbi:site-specific DNA-methyltransferase [Actinokineospora bangkokensis]|nr:site-specific DNA-methyltransferase [Actinokineospora bangkokensis]
MTVSDEDSWTLWSGDALDLLRRVPEGSVSAVITDPPYSSGGTHSTTRKAPPRLKYHATDAPGPDTRVDYTGDNRDQRSWAHWCALWLGQALRATEPGGVLAMTCDWRQLPAATDALQAGGWVWRGW